MTIRRRRIASSSRSSVSDLLEIREAVGAFERIETWLAGQGFFGTRGAELVADLYLGYGLSQSIRRNAAPAPAEPCPALPLAACRLRENGVRRPHAGSFAIGDWEQTWTSAEYCGAILEVRAAIARGDVYQVNLVQHLSAPFAGDPHVLASRLAAVTPLQPAPFVTDDWAVVSASPELFLARRGDRIWTMPIKGTRPRGEAAELRESQKDAAEHVMIVDLERNDLSRVCRAGTVHWPELMATRELAGVEHMVSTVEGKLRSRIRLAEILAATFPGGSVTGAPKIAAVDLIAELEPVGRGAAMGAIGRVYGNGDFDLALTIRTFAIAEGVVHLWVGGGVVWDSVEAKEVEESWTKARPLLEAIGSRVSESVLA
jgi:para-aminobenzoate synthetase component I